MSVVQKIGCQNRAGQAFPQHTFVVSHGCWGSEEAASVAALILSISLATVSAPTRPKFVMSCFVPFVRTVSWVAHQAGVVCQSLKFSGPKPVSR